MTISTARPETPLRRASGPRGRRSRGGFSIVELMLAMGIASMALAAVLSTVMFIARGSVSTADYSDMDREARTGLEVFARDVRMSSGVTSFSAQALDLNVVTAVNADGTTTEVSVNYTYVPNDRTLYREYGKASQRALIRNIETFELSRYSIAIDSSTGLQREASNHLETKQIQLELRSVRTGPARAFTSNNVVSARYVLRNKIDR